MEKNEAEIIVDVELPWNDESEYETHCYRSGTVFYVSRALHLQIHNSIFHQEKCKAINRPNDFIKRKINGG